MSSILNNDNFVSVLPRILDPGMRFTKESILNSNIKNTTENALSTEKEAVPQKQITFDKKENLDNENSQKSNSFLSDYKYIILIVIISIVIIIIAYRVYKYFDNKNNQKKIEIVPNKEEVKLLDSQKSTCDIDKNIKDENVKEYISNYIINEDDDDDDDENNEESNIEEESNQDDVNITQSNKEIINTPIIQKPTAITNTNISIDSNIVLDDNLDTADKNIYELSNENLESENIDSLLNSLDTINNYVDVNEDNDYNADNDNDNDSDSDNIPIFEELGYESENSNTNEESNNKLDNITKDDVDDDLKYFKKFTKK